MIAATVAGNVGRDAEIQHTNGGMVVLKFSVASSTKRGDRENTTWVSCALWGKRGQALADYLTKGAQVVVAGSVTMTEGKDGKPYLNMDVSDVKLMGGGSRSGGGGGGGQRSSGGGGGSTGAPQGQHQSIPEDDDVPF